MLYEHALSINRSENEPPEPILFKDASEYAIILSFNHYCVAKMSSIWSGSLVKHHSQVSLIFAYSDTLNSECQRDFIIINVLYYRESSIPKNELS